MARSRALEHEVPGAGDHLLRAFGVRDDRVDPSGLLAVASRWENEVAAATVLASGGFAWGRARAIATAAFQRADADLRRKADRTPPFADARPCLDRLGVAGVLMGVVSADTPELTVDFVARYGLQGRLPVALGSTVSLAKPDPELLRRACRQLGVLPAQTIAIGDASSDVQMARAAGLAGVIGVARSPGQLPDLDGADVIVSSLDEVWVRPLPRTDPVNRSA